jgi:endoglucanase
MQTRVLAIVILVGLSLLVSVRARSSEGPAVAGQVPPPASPTLALNRGICLDRQFRTIPPEPIMRITRDDIRLIKSMGFEFVKLIVNPEPLLSDKGLSDATRWYLQEIVQLVVDEGLPVVVCIHPEWKFKEKVLSDTHEFSRFVGFLEETGRFLATSWDKKQLALQLMTEPGGNALDWNELQPRMWQAARRAMPDHTLILAGDQVGKIEGLVTTKPVNDDNVMYSFTFYDPFVLTMQGAEWLTPGWWSHLGGVPYPASPDVMRDLMPALIEKIPASPGPWRHTVERVLSEYGEERWNREKIAANVRRLVDWNNSHGGGLKIWCAEFGCYQRTIDAAARYRYLQDVREAFESHGIGWAYWSYNETLTVMTPERQPFGPASVQTPDKKLLEVLFGSRTRSGFRVQ